MGRRRERVLGLAASTALGLLLLTATAAPTAGAVTIGQLAPGSPPPANCSSGPVDLLNPTVGSGDSYIVPATSGATAWTVNSWSHSAAAGLGQTVKMKLFRKVGEPDRYQVVAHDGPRALTPSTVNTFATNIQVKPGDVLGLNDANASTVPNACLFSAPGGFAYARVGDLPDGQAETFILDALNVLYNVSAVVDPTNAFTLGAITRNRKKGTATLTATVPNPGELTGSGKGVKIAGVAVIAKTVSAPGDAQLLIKAKGKKKQKLNETGKVKVNPKITYTPTGGNPSTQSTKVNLKKKL